MKIDSITIENLLSFDRCTFNLKKYNVIVGPNGSGKTNLLRILKIMTSDDNRWSKIVTEETKHTPWKSSHVALTVETTNGEARLILQLLFDVDIKPEQNLRSWRNFTIITTWERDRGYPDIIVYFQNGIIVVLDGPVYYISHYQSSETSNYDCEIKNLCQTEYMDVLRAIRKHNRIGIDDIDTHKIIHASSDFFTGKYTECYIRGEEKQMPSNTRRRSDLLEYLPSDDSTRRIESRIGLDTLLCLIIKNNFVQIMEIHPKINTIAKNLLKLKTENESGYTSLQSRFAKIFPNTKIKVERHDKASRPIVWIEENKKTYELDNSASGYVEAIHILYSIANRTDCTIFLDEPEIHFHPLLIRKIRQILVQMTAQTGNQITVISHSPEFVERRMLTSVDKALTVVTRNNNKSIVASPKNIDVKLKLHLIDPVMFFSNAVFLVEGPSDAAVIRAISDKYDGMFDKHGITIITCEGYKNVGNFTKLLNFYSITYYGLADKEYTEQDSIVKLDGNLESELKKIMSINMQKNKADITTIYDEITEFLATKNNIAKLKKTDIWASIEKAAIGQGININDVS